jgi:antitoxin ParD1/3/4
LAVVIKYNHQPLLAQHLDIGSKKYHNLIFIGIFGGNMAKNTSITLGGHFDDFINSQIKSGRFNSTSEVVRAGLRLLENSETKIEILRSMLKEGEDSGIAEYSYDNFIAELDSEYET